MLLSSTAFAQSYYNDYYPPSKYSRGSSYSSSTDIRDQIMDRNQNAMRNQLNREMLRNERAMDYQELRMMERNMDRIRSYDRY